MRLTIDEYLQAFELGHSSYIRSNINDKEKWHIEDLTIYTEDYTRVFRIVADALNWIEYKRQEEQI